uniref:Translation initiation factor eIF2B subunit delta n=2 Tax=Lutzomyia longipalpis TaxID=7200 RepID=A0A1B0CB69_LUTLO
MEKEKTREEILQERKAKKLEKKSKNQPKEATAVKVEGKPEEKKESPVKVAKVEPAARTTSPVKKPAEVKAIPEKKEEGKDLKASREEILAQREAKKLAKQSAKQKAPQAKTEPESESTKVLGNVEKSNTDTDLAEKMETLTISDAPKAKTTTKAERRAIQEAQRAAKEQKMKEKSAKDKPAPVKPAPKTNAVKVSPTARKVVRTDGAHSGQKHRVKLFNHLYRDYFMHPPKVSGDYEIHEAIRTLGAQFSKMEITGANARCYALLTIMKVVIKKFRTPPEKEFSRCLETYVGHIMEYLEQCRPMAVSMVNAMKYLKWQITQLPTDIVHVPDPDSEEEDDPHIELKMILFDIIDTYIKDQLDKADLAITWAVQEKIADGDVILTFGGSSLVKQILKEAHNRSKKFRVIVADAAPLHEGRDMTRKLIDLGIDCTCVLITAVTFIMQDVTKVLLGANSLLANGYVMSRAGTAQIALVAKSHNVPVLVCCETHKFSERVQTDAFVYNEIGSPDDLVPREFAKNSLQNWRANPYLTPLHLYYDITPPELVTAVITEIAILPCTSVPVILRIKPTEIGY